MFFTLRLSFERWKFNNLREVWVSSLGRILEENKIMRQYRKNKYLGVRFKSGKSISVHRLVLETWNPIPNMAEMTVDHLNHNHYKNSIENLEWVSCEENLRRADVDCLEARKCGNLEDLFVTEELPNSASISKKIIAKKSQSKAKVNSKLKQTSKSTNINARDFLFRKTQFKKKPNALTKAKAIKSFAWSRVTQMSEMDQKFFQDCYLKNVYQIQKDGTVQIYKCAFAAAEAVLKKTLNTSKLTSIEKENMLRKTSYNIVRSCLRNDNYYNTVWTFGKLEE